jgi:hypothetical protein
MEPEHASPPPPPREPPGEPQRDAPQLDAPQLDARPGLLQSLSYLFRTYAIPQHAVRLQPPFRREDRHCYLAPVPADWPSDAQGLSGVLLLEDGEPLGPAHCSHDDIRTLGKGRYSHWGTCLYFSSSDHTDPNSNGRVYSLLPP